MEQDRATGEGRNHRNGATRKRVLTGDGHVEVTIPRDREPSTAIPLSYAQWNLGQFRPLRTGFDWQIPGPPARLQRHGDLALRPRNEHPRDPGPPRSLTSVRSKSNDDVRLRNGMDDHQIRPDFCPTYARRG